MDFLGEKGTPYPTLKKASGRIRSQGTEKVQSVWEKIHHGLSVMAEHGFVHGDLSPYNILYNKQDDSVYFIDISQSFISRKASRKRTYSGPISGTSRISFIDSAPV
jgi:serine/threonine-protein kinase RIO1